MRAGEGGPQKVRYPGTDVLEQVYCKYKQVHQYSTRVRYIRYVLYIILCNKVSVSLIYLTFNLLHMIG